MSLLAVLPCALLAAGPDAKAYVDKAKSLVDQLKYPDAEKALDQAAALGGTDLASTLTLFELQGLVAGALKQPDKARRAFQTLLTLNPEHKLKGSWPPRVKTPYFEAKGLVEQSGALSFTALPPASSGAKIDALGFSLGNDPLKLAREVRVHLKTSGAWELVTRPASGEIWVPVHAPTVQWWAELLGDKGMTLARLATEQQPRTETPAPAAAPAAADAPVAAAPLAPTDAPPPAPPLVQHSRSPLRPTAYAVGAAAVVAAGVGAVFGVLSSNARNRLLQPMLDADGAVIGLTRTDAQELERNAHAWAMTADLLWGTAGAMAVVAVVLWLVGD